MNRTLVFFKCPVLAVFAEQHAVAVQCINPDADIGEWFHPEVILDECGVSLDFLNRRALHEQTVAHVLEVGIDFLDSRFAEICDRA